MADNFDEKIVGQAELSESASDSTEEKTFDKDEFKRIKREERNAAYALADAELEKIRTNPDELSKYLDTQANLPRYAVTNALLITAQLPGAKKLKSFADWRAQNVSVKRGSRAITVLDGAEYVRGDGTTAIGFTAKRVFDVSQTTDRAPAAPSKVDDPRAEIAALAGAVPYAVVATDTPPAPDTLALYDNKTQTINCMRSSDTAELFRQLTREAAHAELATTVTAYGREEQAFAADCAAYMLCRRYGATPPPVPQVPAQLDAKALKSDLSRAAVAVRTTNERVYEYARSQAKSKTTSEIDVAV
ncbi:MAG: hypothetical protein LBQ91_01975 [Oscillospiraceae bacterium]|jgi:hypothetical protein|nr:hypothetical protein [Oscillospiraceae bacterium]